MSDSAHLPVPGEPEVPTTPTSSQTPGSKAKKANPLIDLIDTEKTYVDNLTGIIRKVAGAWSRSNLPPPELDTMFRSIEGVYKANRGLHSKLKEIGANPQNPKALGDLLMGWIEDLQAPYSSYCNKYSAGFDYWDPVQRNQKLGPALEAFSATNPPNSSPDGAVWTLDSLFLLPKARLKYYRKLYNRLLKSTAPGRSDHRLLVNALETLDGLLETLEHRGSIAVGTPAQPTAEAEDEVVINMRTRSMSPPAPSAQLNLSPMRPSNEVITSNPGSESGSARGSVTSGRLSRETANTSISRGSNATLSMPLSNLESRLSTARTLDIFTMNPKVVKLQMSPPGLTFTRELRTSIDVTVRFMSRATNQEVIHYQGHIYLLSDLFLICERMTQEEQAQHSNDGADMWLCYPPLAGKVLRISEVEGQDNALQVAIMRKEFLILETDSRERRDQLIAHFNDCIEFSGSLPPPSKVAPPPVPSLPPMARGQNNGSPHSQFDGPPPNYQDNNLPPLPPNDGSGPIRTSASAQPFNGPGSTFINGPPRSTSFNAGPPGPLGMRPGMTMSPPNGSMSPPPGMHPGQIMQHPNGSMSPPPHMQQPFPPNQNMRPGPGPGFPPGQGGFPPGQGFPPRSNFPPGGGPPGQGFPPGPPGSGFPPGAGRPPNFQPGMGPQYGQQMPPRPPSEPSMNNLRKSPSSRSVNSQYSQHHDPMRAPPMPPFYNAGMGRNHSQPSLHAPQARPLLPSAQPATRGVSMAEPYFDEPSPPNSPVPEMPQHTGPVTTVISAQMKCKVFLQQQHAQWKSLGSAKLKLYRQDPTNIKQLVVEADDKKKSILISTIVLTDGVERVGKTGIAIELSSNGARTGVIYMIQLRNEESTSGLFNSLLAGSDRANI